MSELFKLAYGDKAVRGTDRIVPLRPGLFPASFGSAEAFLAAMTRSIGAMTTYVDRNLRMQYCNDHFASVRGVTAADLLGQPFAQVLGSAAFAEIEPGLRQALDGHAVHVERKLEHADGSVVWISVHLAPHFAADGSVAGVFTSSLEVDELKRKAAQLDRSMRELAFHIENSPLAVIEWTGGKILKRWSPQAEKIFGWREAEVLGRRTSELNLVHPDSRELVRAVSLELLEGRARRNRMLARHVTRDGRTIHCEWYNSVYADAHGQVLSILSLVQDVTERIEAEEQLRNIAVHDSLTGLANRQALMTRLNHAIERARRSGESFGVLYIDLDGFKQVNDNYGHAVGDELLKVIARVLKRCVRGTDTIARLGGDEFVVLLEVNVDVRTPARISTRITGEIGRRFAVMGREIDCGASVGAVRFPEDGGTADELIAVADARMYRAKRR